TGSAGRGGPRNGQPPPSPRPPRPRPRADAGWAMRFDVLTLFPEIFAGYLTQSLLKLAIDQGLVQAHIWDIRQWAKGKHKSVDDRPFGGGPGMVLMCEPIVEGVEAGGGEGPGAGGGGEVDATG